MENRLIYNVYEEGCIEFLQKYGKGQLSESIKVFSLGDGDLMSKYQKWIEWKDKTKPNFGGTPEHLLSKMFNIDEVVINYDWGKLDKYSWFEIFQYLHDIINNK